MIIEVKSANMKKICIVIPYFGKFPRNMYTFLLSCKYNKTIDWLIFTDQNFNQYKNFCSNVNFVSCNLSDIKHRIIKVTKLNDINLDRPYKLCDYRPLFGKIFSHYLKGYDYWGYSDLDVVYGNLLKYIKDGIKNDFDKIGENGHFTLFKNNKKVNNLYKLPIIKNHKKIYLFKDYVSQHAMSYSFDEFKGINVICKQHVIKTYINKDLVNDLLFENLDLNTNDRRYTSKYSCYVWNHGHAQYYYKKHGKICMHEYGYFHFQKRREFSLFISFNESIPAFSITTHGYSIMDNVNIETIKNAMNRNKSSFIKRFKYILHWYFLTDEFTSIHVGRFYLPVKYIAWRILLRHDFKI